jgi:cytosine permease
MIFMEDKDFKRSPLKPVPLNERKHWVIPATIFGGLEFAVPVIMVGATLIGNFSLIDTLLILFIGLVIIQWIGNAIQGHIGAKTGLPASVIARSSFGEVQARYVVGLALVILNVGWFGINTSVAGNALSATLGINYSENFFPWMLITLFAGLLFALPAVLGYNSMKWTDYIAVPAGIILIIFGVTFAITSMGGWSNIIAWNPEPSLTFLGAISLVIGANVAQWLIASDYTRFSKPKIKDQALIPLGIVVIGMLFFMTGAVMSVGAGEPDIVLVMQDLGFPFWGFLILWIALWTSQIVASYSIGLAASNMFNIDTNKGRMVLTLFGSILGVLLAIFGILNYFEDFLIIMSVIYPAIAGVMFSDFYLIKKQEWRDTKGWDWGATISILVGCSVGYITEYIVPLGIPAIQSLVVSGILFYLIKNWNKKF